MNIQFTNSQDFTTASEKQVKEKWPKIPHWFLSQRDNFLVCATTRYRDSLSSGMAGSSILVHEIYLLAPVHALSFASLPPLETQSVTGWMISPQLEESSAPIWQAWATCPPLESEVKSTLSQSQWLREKERGNFPRWQHTSTKRRKMDAGLQNPYMSLTVVYTFHQIQNQVPMF